MSASLIFDIAPLGSLVAYCDRITSPKKGQLAAGQRKVPKRGSPAATRVAAVRRSSCRSSIYLIIPVVAQTASRALFFQETSS